MYNGRGCRRAGEFRVLREHQESLFLDERAIGNELISLGYYVRIALGGWTLLQNGGGPVKHNKSVSGTLPSCLSPLDTAEEDATARGFRCGLCYRCKNVGAEDWEELPNTG
jgi:hypothetical protein